MILTDLSILAAIKQNNIVIEPYDRSCLGTNSYDVHLSKYLACYTDEVIDAKKHNEVKHFEIPEDGIVLQPGKTYLGSTIEYTETREFVPFLEENRVLDAWGLIFMLQQVRVMWDFVIIGLLKFLYHSQFVFIPVCQLGN